MGSDLLTTTSICHGSRGIARTGAAEDEITDHPASCAFCGASAHRVVGRFDAPPEGETDFGIIPYARALWQCLACGHVVNRYGFTLPDDLYDAGYVSSTYGDRLAATFDRIMALPPERSDNRRRVARVAGEADRRLGPGRRRLLDVGSGLGVFPAAMAAEGWEATALDPDARATAMLGARAPVETVTGDFATAALPGRFDLVTLNKVLEHVAAPVALLARVRDVLAPDGLCYVELPDGEAALDAGADREEFFVEHLDAYAMASAALLARAAGFRVVRQERLVEPSGKFTLFLFLAASPA